MRGLSGRPGGRYEECMNTFIAQTKSLTLALCFV